MSPIARVDDGQRNHGFLAQHQHIERVVVFGQGLGNEAIVCGIVDRRVQDAVELDQAARLVQFVFHARAEGNLYDGVELLRKLATGSYVVPRMDHGIGPAFVGFVYAAGGHCKRSGISKSLGNDYGSEPYRGLTFISTTEIAGLMDIDGGVNFK
jgi:hypothetical protein